MRLKILVAVLLVAVLVGFLWRGHETEKPVSGHAQAQTAVMAPGSPPGAPSPTKVRRLAPGERKQLGEAIHAAIRKASASAAAGHPGGSAPALPDEPLLHLEEIGPNVKAALELTIPELAKCYEGKTGANKMPLAIMEMVSDPDFGTVIDTTQIIDADGKPLPKDIDECLRDTADSLSLPPLGKPGRLPIQYTFRFD
ncbi:MAG: hypothetical protein ABI678_27390 [Kofleriaceae bacterium]